MHAATGPASPALNAAQRTESDRAYTFMAK